MLPFSSRVLFVVILFAVLLGGVFILAVQIPDAWELSDFNVTFYRMARYMMRGENIYLNAYPHPFNGREYPPFAPIWSLYFFVPLGSLPLDIADGLRVAMDIALMPLLAYLSMRWARLKHLWSAALLVGAPWVLVEIHTGQLTPFVFLGTFLCYWGVRQSNAWTTSVGLWLALAKPNLVALIILATFFFAWRKRILWRTLVILLGLVVVGSLASPLWFRDLLQMYVARLLQPRLSDAVLLFPGYPWGQLILLAAGTLFLLGYATRFDLQQPTPWLWAVLLTASLIGALHTFIYDWQLLMLPLALLIRSRWGSWFVIGVYGYAFLWAVLSAGLNIPIPSVKILPGIVLAAILGWGVARLRRTGWARAE